MNISESTDVQLLLRYVLEPGRHDPQDAMWAAARLAQRSRKVLGAGLGEADVIYTMGDPDVPA